MSTLYKTIIALCEEKGIKGGRLCTDTGISKGLLTDLKMGRRTGVSAKTAQKIASYFNVTVGYLLGEEEKEIKKEDAISDIFVRMRTDSKFLEATQTLYELNDQQLDAVITMLSTFKKD